MTLRSQLRGTVDNVRRLVSGTTLRDLLPPSIVSTLLFIRDSIPRALGFTDGPQAHLTGIIVFSVFLIIASLSLLTWVALLFAIVALPVAGLRLIPAVDDLWPLARADWPLWSVQT